MTINTHGIYISYNVESKLVALMERLAEVQEDMINSINLLNREQSTLVACFSEMLIAEGMFGVPHKTVKNPNTIQPCPLRFFVQGTAGVGKSFVFKMIADMCEIRRCSYGLEGVMIPVLKVAHRE